MRCWPLQNLHHFWRALGGWTFAFKDYYEMNITSEIDSKAVYDLRQVVDPYGGYAQCRSRCEGRTGVYSTIGEYHPGPSCSILPVHAHTFVLSTTCPLPHCLCPTHPPPPHPPTLPLLTAVYRDRLTMPKLMICTGGDEFFQPDDSFFYWDQLKEPKFIRSVCSTTPEWRHSGG